MAETILLVEDEALIAMDEARLLERHGYTVITVHGGEKAVETVDSDPQISLVLMDIDLGEGMDGTEAAREILTRHELPVVFLTSHSEEEYVNRVRKITNYGYVLKSAGEFVLAETIRMALELFRSHTNLERENEERRRAEKTRDEYQRLLASTLESVESLLMVIDRDFRIVLSNWKDHEWVPEEDRQRQPYCYQVMKHYAEPCSYCPPMKTFRDGKERQYEDRNPLDGSYKEISVQPIFGPGGEVQYVLENVRDITAQKQYAQQLQRKSEEQTMLLETMEAQAWYLTDAETYGIANQAHADFLGLSKEEIEHKKLREFLEPEVAEVCKMGNREVFDSGETLYSEEWIPNAAGEQRLIAVTKTPKKDEEGRIEYVVCVGTDITEHEQTKRDLAESENRYRTILDAIPDLMFIQDGRGTYLDYHAYYHEALYADPESFMGKTVYEVLPDTVSEPFYDNLRKALETGEVQFYEYELSIGGEKRSFEARIAPYEEDRVISIVREITERKRAEEELRRNQQHYTALFEHAPVAIWEEDFSGAANYLRKLRQEGVEELGQYFRDHPDEIYSCASGVKVLDVNRTAVEMTGFDTKEKLLGTLDETITSASAEMLVKQMQAIWEGRSSMEEIGEIMNTEGKVRDVILRWQVLPDRREDYSRVLVSFLDITERKRAEEEKEFLMRELNHRVKNNLSMLSSLISLKDDELGEAVDLTDISHQIDAIRIVHEKLHQGGEITHIQMKDYLQDILDTVFSSFSSQQVTIENRVAPLSVRTRSAVPVGLIINEIATNAIKHGFRADEQARFTVEMGLNEEESAYCLTVGNSGNPFPEEIDLDSPQSLGMQLITTLVSQLGGTVELRKRPSPLFTIRFPVDEQ